MGESVVIVLINKSSNYFALLYELVFIASELICVLRMDDDIYLFCSEAIIAHFTLMRSIICVSVRIVISEVK